LISFALQRTAKTFWFTFMRRTISDCSDPKETLKKKNTANKSGQKEMQQQEKELGRFYLLSQRCEYLICALTHRNKHIYIYIYLYVWRRREALTTLVTHIFGASLSLKATTLIRTAMPPPLPIQTHIKIQQNSKIKNWNA